MEWRNDEGYPDPTAAEALANVARGERAKAKQYRPLVYICSPYSGEVEYNLNRARGYCRLAIGKGYIPLAPHLLFPQFLDDDDRQQRELGLFFALVLLSKCEEIWAFGNRISEGMTREMEAATRRGIPVRRFTDKGEEDLGV